MLPFITATSMMGRGSTWATDPWEEIAEAIKTQQAIFPNLSYLERMRTFPSHLAREI